MSKSFLHIPIFTVKKFSQMFVLKEENLIKTGAGWVWLSWALSVGIYFWDRAVELPDVLSPCELKID